MSQIILSISHHIYLSRKQRYAIHERKQITLMGISVPVWFNMGSTSEPATEVFCTYQLNNNCNEDAVINTLPKTDGYYINLPQMPDDFEFSESISDDEWRKMSEDQLSSYYKEIQVPLNSEILLDYSDKGGMHMSWKLQNSMFQDGHEVAIKNFISIKDTDEFLTTSLVF